MFGIHTSPTRVQPLALLQDEITRLHKQLDSVSQRCVAFADQVQALTKQNSQLLEENAALRKQSTVTQQMEHQVAAVINAARALQPAPFRPSDSSLTGSQIGTARMGSIPEVAVLKRAICEMRRSMTVVDWGAAGVFGGGSGGSGGGADESTTARAGAGGTTTARAGAVVANSSNLAVMASERGARIVPADTARGLPSSSAAATALAANKSKRPTANFIVQCSLDDAAPALEIVVSAERRATAAEQNLKGLKKQLDEARTVIYNKDKEFGDHMAELKRLRTILRFSVLKQDSDKLHETVEVVEQLERQIARLRREKHSLVNGVITAAGAAAASGVGGSATSPSSKMTIANSNSNNGTTSTTDNISKNDAMVSNQRAGPRPSTAKVTRSASAASVSLTERQNPALIAAMNAGRSPREHQPQQQQQKQQQPDQSIGDLSSIHSTSDAGQTVVSERQQRALQSHHHQQQPPTQSSRFAMPQAAASATTAASNNNSSNNKKPQQQPYRQDDSFEIANDDDDDDYHDDVDAAFANNDNKNGKNVKKDNLPQVDSENVNIMSVGDRAAAYLRRQKEAEEEKARLKKEEEKRQKQQRGGAGAGGASRPNSAAMSRTKQRSVSQYFAACSAAAACKSPLVSTEQIMKVMDETGTSGGCGGPVSVIRRLNQALSGEMSNSNSGSKTSSANTSGSSLHSRPTSASSLSKRSMVASAYAASQQLEQHHQSSPNRSSPRRNSQQQQPQQQQRQAQNTSPRRDGRENNSGVASPPAPPTSSNSNNTSSNSNTPHRPHSAAVTPQRIPQRRTPVQSMLQYNHYSLGDDDDDQDGDVDDHHHYQHQHQQQHDAMRRSKSSVLTSSTIESEKYENPFSNFRGAGAGGGVDAGGGGAISSSFGGVRSSSASGGTMRSMFDSSHHKHDGGRSGSLSTSSSGGASHQQLMEQRQQYLHSVAAGVSNTPNPKGAPMLSAKVGGKAIPLYLI